MLLISPLLQFLEESVCVTAWTETQANNPQIDLGNIKELAREFVEVGSENDTYQSVRHVSTETDVLILQSRTDEVTPAIEAEKRLPLFARRPVYELVETDHAFLNDRDVIQKRIAMFFGVTR
jgi:predicted ATPase